MTAGLDLRHEGIEANLAADTAAHRGYGQIVRSFIEGMPRGFEFSADDVRRGTQHRETAEPPHHPNVLPSVFGTLAAAGVIVRVGEVNAARRSRHGSRNAVWRRS
jgi:hypothetical protein